MQKDYLYEGDNVFFKHETTPNMPKDAYILARVQHRGFSQCMYLPSSAENEPVPSEKPLSEMQSSTLLVRKHPVIQLSVSLGLLQRMWHTHFTALLDRGIDHRIVIRSKLFESIVFTITVTHDVVDVLCDLHSAVLCIYRLRPACDPGYPDDHSNDHCPRILSSA